MLPYESLSPLFRIITVAYIFGVPTHGTHTLCCNHQEFRYTCRKLLSVNALFDNTSVATLESWYSIGVILLIVVLLVVFTATFNHAVIALVVKPIGRVLSAVTIRLGHVADELTGLLVPDELQDADQDLDLSEADILEIMVKALLRRCSLFSPCLH